MNDITSAVEALADLVGLAEGAMHDAAKAGADYDADAELADARAALDRLQHWFVVEGAALRDGDYWEFDQDREMYGECASALLLVRKEEP